MDLLYEDEFFIATNKPAKQFVHPMQGDKSSKDCLLFDIRNYLGQHVYAINRLDRPVSGIVLIAKTPDIVTSFKTIWNNESTHKKYQCLHRGKLEGEGYFDSALSKQGVYKSDKSKEKQSALTLYKAIEYFPDEFCTHTEVEIKTGRYHQIRRHFRKVVMPIIGDRKHGKGAVNQHFEKHYHLEQIFLHAHQLQFYHPITNDLIDIQCPLPHSLQKTLEQLRS